MKELSVTQEFLLCAVNEKGMLPVLGKRAQACIVAGALIELLANGNIHMDEKNRVHTDMEPDAGRRYLQSLYDWLKTKPVKLEGVAQEYVMSLTEKRLGVLMADIGNALAEQGCVSVEKGGLLYAHQRFVPNPPDVDAVIQRVRAEMLEDGQIADETVALAALLERSEQIRRYFSAYEAKQLKARLKEIRATSDGKFVQQIVAYVDRIVTVMVVVSTVH